MSAALASLCLMVAVHDGDTIRCGQERVRIANIDAPELPGSPKCERRRSPYTWCDYAKGNQARAALSAFVRRGTVRISRMGTDSYGRTLAQVTVNGSDAGEYLVSIGLARRWQ